MMFDERDKVVRIRKTHRCSQCGRKFPIGTEMLSVRFLDGSGDSGWCRWHVCKVCEAVLNETDCGDYDGIIYERTAIETDREYWEKRRTEIEGGMV